MSLQPSREWAIIGAAAAVVMALIAAAVPMYRAAFSAGGLQEKITAQEIHIQSNDARIDANAAQIQKIIRENSRRSRQISVHLQRIDDDLKYLVQQAKRGRQ